MCTGLRAAGSLPQSGFVTEVPVTNCMVHLEPNLSNGASQSHTRGLAKTRHTHAHKYRVTHTHTHKDTTPTDTYMLCLCTNIPTHQGDSFFPPCPHTHTHDTHTCTATAPTHTYTLCTNTPHPHPPRVFLHPTHPHDTPGTLANRSLWVHLTLLKGMPRSNLLRAPRTYRLRTPRLWIMESRPPTPPLPGSRPGRPRVTVTDGPPTPRRPPRSEATALCGEGQGKAGSMFHAGALHHHRQTASDQPGQTLRPSSRRTRSASGLTALWPPRMR